MKHIALVYPANSFSTADVATGYARAFNRLGLDVLELPFFQMVGMWKRFAMANSQPVTWAYERASADVIFGVMQRKPDLVVVVDGTQMHDIFWDHMDQLGYKTAVVMTECPYADMANAYIAERCSFPYANDLLSAEKMGIPYLPVAYSDEIHHPMNVSDRYQSDVVFVGTGFRERVDLLEQVDWTGIDARFLGYWKLESPISDLCIDRIVPNSEVAQYYCGSKLVLNLNRLSIDIEGHQKIESRKSVGPRVYEAAACGTTLIAQDGVPELHTLLRGNFVSFSTAKELEEQMRNWLQKDNERRELAKRAWFDIQGEHYMCRAQQLLDTL